MKNFTLNWFFGSIFPFRYLVGGPMVPLFFVYLPVCLFLSNCLSLIFSFLILYVIRCHDAQKVMGLDFLGSSFLPYILVKSAQNGPTKTCLMFFKILFHYILPVIDQSGSSDGILIFNLNSVLAKCLVTSYNPKWFEPIKL